MLKPGDVAPDFKLPASTGNVLRLSNFRGRPVVLYFYPKDHTPICTRQACLFRDRYDLFQKAGAQVLGVSSDGTAAHQKFSTDYKLPFPLLSDEEGKVRKLYGATALFGLMPGRVTFVIDKEGLVRHVFPAQFSAARHIEEALNALS
jgi:peroxiredoxin Q/BCP